MWLPKPALAAFGTSLAVSCTSPTTVFCIRVLIRKFSICRQRVDWREGGRAWIFTRPRSCVRSGTLQHKVSKYKGVTIEHLVFSNPVDETILATNQKSPKTTSTRSAPPSSNYHRDDTFLLWQKVVSGLVSLYLSISDLAAPLLHVIWPPRPLVSSPPPLAPWRESWGTLAS